MRTDFVFPDCERADVVATLDRLLPEQREPWLADGSLYVNIDNVGDGGLFCAAALAALLGR